MGLAYGVAYLLDGLLSVTTTTITTTTTGTAGGDGPVKPGSR